MRFIFIFFLLLSCSRHRTHDYIVSQKTEEKTTIPVDKKTPRFPIPQSRNQKRPLDGLSITPTQFRPKIKKNLKLKKIQLIYLNKNYKKIAELELIQGKCWIDLSLWAICEVKPKLNKKSFDSLVKGHNSSSMISRITFSIDDRDSLVDFTLFDALKKRRLPLLSDHSNESVIQMETEEKVMFLNLPRIALRLENLEYFNLNYRDNNLFVEQLLPGKSSEHSIKEDSLLFISALKFIPKMKRSTNSSQKVLMTLTAFDKLEVLIDRKWNEWAAPEISKELIKDKKRREEFLSAISINCSGKIYNGLTFVNKFSKAQFNLDDGLYFWLSNVNCKNISLTPQLTTKEVTEYIGLESLYIQTGGYAKTDSFQSTQSWTYFDNPGFIPPMHSETRKEEIKLTFKIIQLFF